MEENPIGTAIMIPDGTVSACAGGIKDQIDSNTSIHFYKLPKSGSPDLKANTKYHVRMKFTDAININDTLETDEVVFTTLATQIAHAPLSTVRDVATVGVPTVPQLAGTEALVTYDSGTNVDSRLYYRESSDGGVSDVAIDDSFTGATEALPAVSNSEMHPYHLAGLTPGKTYLVKMRLTDNNDVDHTTFSLNTGTAQLTTPVFTPPVLSAISPTVVKQWSDTEAVAYLTADVNATAKLCYSTTNISDVELSACIGADGSGNNSSDGVVNNLGGASKLQTFQLTNLEPNKAYYIRARVVDENVVSTYLDSAEVSFTTKLAQQDHVPLLIAPYDPDMTIALSDDSIGVTFDAGTSSNSKLCFASVSGIDMLTCTAVAPQISNSKIHSYVIPNLEADTTYYLKMQLSDAVNSADVLNIAEKSFKTLPIQIAHVPLSKVVALPDHPTAVMTSGQAAVVTYDSKTNVQSELCYKDYADGIDIQNDFSNCTLLDAQKIPDSVLHSYMLDATHNSELLPGHVYQVRMRLTDFNDVNNTTHVVMTNIGTFTTPVTPVATLNDPGDPQLVQVSDSEAIIKLPTTNTDATSRLCYGTAVITDVDTCATFVPIDGATKTHYYHLTGLPEETPIYVASKVINVENQNNYFVSSGKILDESSNLVDYFTTKKKQVDATGPLTTISTPGLSDMTIGYDYAVINWTTDQPANQTLNCGIVSGVYTETANELNHYNTLHSLKIGGLNPDTKYYCIATSEDSLGNAKSSAEFDFTTTKDLTTTHSPVSSISDIIIPTELISDGHAVVTFKTDQPAVCYAKMTTSQGSYTNPAIVQEDGYVQEKYNLTHSISFIDLIPTTKYYFNLYCHDDLFGVDPNSLEISSAQESQFKTLEKLYTLGGLDLDTTKPEISGVKVSSVTGESVLISWTTNEKASSSVRFGTLTIDENMAGNSFVNKDELNYVTAHEVLVNNLVPATKYVFAVSSADASGNISSSAQESFTTDSPSALSSIKVTSTAIDRATITWMTASPTSSIVEYGITEEYGQIKSDAALVKEHSISLSDLDSSKEYHFRVKGKDKSGNIYASSDYTFEPKSPPKIENVKVDKITEHGATIVFKTNVATDSLVVYTDAKDEKNTGSQGDPEMKNDHSVELKNLEPGATFKIRVKVRDADGNEAEEIGKEFTVGKDINAPKIDQVKTDSALAQNDKVQTIISWTTDEPSTTAIIYQEGKTGEEKEVKINNSLTNSHVAVITTFKSGVVYYFKVKSVDQSGNEAVSNDFALLTPKKKENIIQIIIGNFQDIFGWIKM